MPTVRTHPLDQRAIIRHLVHEIETIRRLRQAAVRASPHPQGKRFSQEEVRQCVCPSYHNLLEGVTQRLPSRAMVLHIAEYLECTVGQTNDLLLAAQYVPEVLAPRADEVLQVMTVAQSVLHTLPLPAVMLTADGVLEAANPAFAALNGFPLEAIPRAIRTICDFVFNVDVPTAHLMRPDAATWQQNAVQVVSEFRSYHRSWQREAQAEARLQRYLGWPEFKRSWHHATAEPQPQYCFRWRAASTQTIIRTQHTPMRFGGGGYPIVVVCRPADAATWQVFRDLGCAVVENRWEAALPQPET